MSNKNFQPRVFLQFENVDLKGRQIKGITYVDLDSVSEITISDKYIQIGGFHTSLKEGGNAARIVLESLVELRKILANPAINEGLILHPVLKLKPKESVSEIAVENPFIDEDYKSRLETENFAQKSKIVPIYELSNLRTVTLLDMLKFHADKFMAILKSLAVFRANLKQISDKGGAGTPMPETAKPLMVSELNELKEYCKEAGLNLSVIEIDQTLAILEKDNCLIGTFVNEFAFLERTVDNELSLPVFFVITNSKAKYFENITPFGQKVFDNFPSANFDIEEASKCFAAARYTASVMHLMRCLEVALNSIRTALSIPALSNPNWQNVINHINSQITANKAALGVSWKAEEEFYTNAVAHLSTVKNAWRNPTMHIERKYTEDEAEDIFNAVKGFMRHLANHLDEVGTFTV